MSSSTAKRLRRSSIQTQHTVRKLYKRYLDASKELCELESTFRQNHKAHQAQPTKTVESRRAHLDYIVSELNRLVEKRKAQRHYKEQARLGFCRALGLLNRIREERGRSDINRNFDELFAAVVIRKELILKK